MTTTSSPRASNASTRLEPMKPAPPVTTERTTSAAREARVDRSRALAQAADQRCADRRRDARFGVTGGAKRPPEESGRRRLRRIGDATHFREPPRDRDEQHPVPPHLLDLETRGEDGA